MDDTITKKIELLIRTREEDYQELSNKITQVNKQLKVVGRGVLLFALF